jgi:pyruvate formate lyase activating enzyme
MLISGFQKSTLLDYPGKLACLVFTYVCNLRCEYCHKPELVIQPLKKRSSITEEEIFSFLEKRKNLVDGVVITGGEPTIQKDLIPFIKKIKNMGFLVKLDTNGTDSRIVKKILEMNIVDYWAMDIKYDKEIYIQNLENKIKYEEVEKSIKLIMENAKDYEFRTTYVKGIHTTNSVKGIGEFIKGSKRYYIQDFRPGKTINPTLNDSNSFTQKELENFKKLMQKYVKQVEIR